MMWLRSCPKCHGDLFLRKDYEETTIACLQCGRTAVLDDFRRGFKSAPAAAQVEPDPAAEGRHHRRLKKAA